MASNRKYPIKTCVNPDCNKEYIPHDKRQKYCCEQCRININNDKNITEYKDVKYQQKLQQSDQRLASLYCHLGRKENVVERTLLKYLKVDLTIGSISVYENLGYIIRWYNHFGIRRIGEKYIIYCRSEFESYL